jgi:hypothetical protein
VKHILTLISILITLNCPLKATEILVLEGLYQGKNLFVQNTIPESGVGYSIFEVTVNGNQTTDELNSWAIEVDLASLAFNLGDSIVVRIKYKPGPQPKVLNPEVLLPLSTYEIVSQNITNQGVYSWTTINENGKLTFIVEQFKWSRWVKAGEVYGVGLPTENTYTFTITPTSGKNKVRVSQLDFSKQYRHSKSLEFTSEVKEVKLKKLEGETKFIFSSKTLYEIHDYQDNLKMKGFNDQIDFSNLPKGPYYLYYDNKTTSFAKISN